MLFVVTSCAYAAKGSPASERPECTLSQQDAGASIVKFYTEDTFNNCTRDCSFFTKADTQDALANSTKTIARDIFTNIGSLTTTASSQVVESSEVEYTDESYFWFLLFAIPFLLHMFYKPIEFKILQQCRKHGRCIQKKKLVKRRVLKRVPSTANVGGRRFSDGGTPVADKPVSGIAAGSSDGGGGTMDEDAAKEKQKQFKWKVTSSDRYLWSTGSGGAAPMNVDFGAKLLPRSAPGGGRQTQTVLVEVEVESWEDPDGTEAWDNTFEAIYNGGAWQEWVSRRVCGCCWEKVDAARMAQEKAEGGGETKKQKRASVAQWQQAGAGPGERPWQSDWKSVGSSAGGSGVEMAGMGIGGGGGDGNGGEEKGETKQGMTGSLADGDIAVRVNPSSEAHDFGGGSGGGGEPTELVANFSDNTQITARVSREDIAL
jgi:hypothetical protein